MIDDEWSDYDGNAIYSDFDISGGAAVESRMYLAGVSQADEVGGGHWDHEQYYHGDQLGSTRALTDDTGAVSRKYAYTVFGELMSTSGTAETRYQCAGAWGYQTNVDFPFLHVGARLHDPETGRFLQRDPIGIRGGLIVYEYVGNNPGLAVDPSGLIRLLTPRELGILTELNRRIPTSRYTPIYQLVRNNIYGAEVLRMRICAVGAVGVAATAGAVAGRAVDRGFARVNNDVSISDGLADILYYWIWDDGSGYDPWGR